MMSCVLIGPGFGWVGRVLIGPGCGWVGRVLIGPGCGWVDRVLIGPCVHLGGISPPPSSFVSITSITSRLWFIVCSCHNGGHVVY